MTSLAPLSRRVLLAAAAVLALPFAHAAAVDDAVAEVQREWEVIRYQAPAAEREKRFEALAAKAHKASEANPAAPSRWCGKASSSVRWPARRAAWARCRS